jgi:transcriptional regulator of acetoin/glycerol metabolism
MCTGSQITPADLPITVRQRAVTTESRRSRGNASSGASSGASPGASPDLDRSLRELRESWLATPEADYLHRLLVACHGNVRAAARRAGIDAVTLYRLLKKRGIRVRRDVDRASGQNAP